MIKFQFSSSQAHRLSEHHQLAPGLDGGVWGSLLSNGGNALTGRSLNPDKTEIHGACHNRIDLDAGIWAPLVMDRSTTVPADRYFESAIHLY